MKINKKSILITLLVLFFITISFFPYNLMISKAEEVEEFLSLTSTAQTTDYVVTIGEEIYTIDTIEALVDANLALLEWEAKGTEDIRQLSGTFNGVTYNDFSDIYSRIYNLLLVSATKEVLDGETMPNALVASGIEICKISGTVLAGETYITVPANAKFIIVAEDNATISYVAKTTRYNIGRADPDDGGIMSIQGAGTDKKITLKGKLGTANQTYSPFILKSGSLYFNNVVFSSFGYASSTISTIYIPSGHDAARYLYMSNSTVTNLTSTDSPFLYCRAFSDTVNSENEKSRLYLYNNTFSNCTVKNNSSSSLGKTVGGAVIRSYAADTCGLHVEDCEFLNNRTGTGSKSDYISATGGGAIYWKSVANTAILKNCTFNKNSTISVGGAIYNTGNMEIIGCIFEENKANYGGGAIAVEPPFTQSLYESIDVTNLSGTLTLDKNTIIRNNQALKYGGGIFFSATECAIKDPVPNYEMELIINGASITNNTSSGYGAGVAMNLNYKEHNYKTGITINEGSVITGNVATTDGGAIWMGNTETCACNANEGIVMNGGTIEGNSAKNGGAICISTTQTQVPMNFKMNNGTVQNNTSTKYGGAVYILNGNFIMTSGNIKQNTATDNGGAIYLEKGNVNIDNGNIQNCTATNGGGIYISGGDMEINNGQINGCEATSGGGIYIFDGDFTMEGGNISNNQAFENGGGIYASSDSKDLNITVTSGSIIGNIANSHGGGIGVNMGEGLVANIEIGLESCKGIDETHSHPIIQGNTANEMGGGFSLHGNSLTVTLFCGQMSSNISIKEPGSSNINQTGGVVNVHGAVVDGGITIIGGEYVSDSAQISKVKVMYDSNIEGILQNQEAEISPGVVISLPKNLYTRESYKLVGWAVVSEPTENDIIYDSGELYTVPNENVTLYAVWLHEGAGKIEEPVITSGKIYEDFTGGINVMISSDSAFSTMMSVLNMQPNVYKDRTLVFSNGLEIGTTITMIDLSNVQEREYYYYKVEDDTLKNIALDSFTKMGSNVKYTNPTTESLTNEKYIFIVDMADDNLNANSTQMKLVRYSSAADVAEIEQTVSFTTTAQREFIFSWSNQPSQGKTLTVSDNFNFVYEKSNPIGEETRYDGKKLSIVVEPVDKNSIPLDSKLFDGTNYYELNSNRQFIVPFGLITENKSISFNLISKSLLFNEEALELKAELWVTGNENDSTPFMGCKVAEIDNIVLSAALRPALKVELNKRIYEIQDFSTNMELSYVTENLEDYNVTLEIQKKSSEQIYETRTDLLKSVNNKTSNQNGVFTLLLNTSGNIVLKFSEQPILTTGTYRILIKVKNGNEEIFNIPYNFIVK